MQKQDDGFAVSDRRQPHPADWFLFKARILRREKGKIPPKKEKKNFRWMAALSRQTGWRSMRHPVGPHSEMDGRHIEIYTFIYAGKVVVVYKYTLGRRE